MNNQFGFNSGLGTGFNQPFTGKTVNDTINNIDKWQAETKQKYSNEKTIAMENSAKNMYECAMRTNDGQVRKQNLSGANLSNMEIIIKQAAQEHGSDAYDDLGEGQILCRFMQKNPQYEQITNGTLGGDVNLKTWARVIGANTSMPQQQKEQQKDSSTWMNILQGVGDTLMGPGKFISNQIDKGTAWVAKQVSDNDEAIDEQLQENIEYMPTLPNVDREGTSYQASNILSDLGATVATSFIPGLGAEKWAELLGKAPKLIKFAQKSPKMAKIISNIVKNGYEGSRDMAILNAYNAEGTDVGEATEGAVSNILINSTLKGAGKLINKLPGAKTLIERGAEKLEVMGNLNPTDVRNAMKKLAERGEFDGYNIGPNDIGKYLLERDIKGSKEEMYRQLLDHSDNAKAILTDALNQSTTIHNVPTATKALNAIAEDLKGVAGLEDDLKIVQSLIKDGDNYTATELEKIKEVIDDYESIYTAAGDVKAGFGARGMDKMRKEIKKTIEKIGEEEGLGNIRALNNEIAMARTLAYGMGNKSASEIVNQWTSGALGGLATAVAGGDLSSITVMGAVSYLLGSTRVRTALANAIKKAGGIESKTLDEVRNFIASEGKTQLSTEGQSALKKILSENKDILEGVERGVQTQIIRRLDQESEEE